MRKLVFATNNRHKLEEVAAKINNDFQLLTLADIGCMEDIEETGSTFKENAAIKSHFVYNHYQLDCFGDDSGLAIDALNGQPGVYSARYAGEHGNHEANIEKVLTEMKSAANRRARFISVICLLLNGESYFFEGTVEGTIRAAKSGAEGFGYDPIFQPDGYEITFAEMSLEEKNRISHRGKAVDQMVQFLSRL